MSGLPKISTNYWPKPIPLRGFDWQAVYDDYDGAEDSGNRGHIGHGSTEAEAVVELIELYPRGIQCERDVCGVCAGGKAAE